MGEEVHTDNEMEYMEYAGNCFLIDKGILKDVRVESETVRIPEQVTEIRRQAFLDARLEGRMEILLIPASVRKIERLSFASMPRLHTVEMLAGIVTLEQGVFRNCMQLETILLPNTLRQIESRAFENCLRLRNVLLPQVRVQISEDAFLNCVNVKDKRIEKAMEEAGYKRKKEEEEARRAKFPHLYKEEEVIKPEVKVVHETEKQAQEVQEEQGLSAAEELLEAMLRDEGISEVKPLQDADNEAHLCIHEGVLERCEVQGNKVVIPEGVTALADRVFYGRKELEEIVFPSTLSYIGVQALEGTGWLDKEREKSSYVIVNGILVSAFYNSMVMEAKLPETIYRIAPYAFYQSEAQLVIFSESVREVDARAFVESGVTEIDFSTRADVRVHPPLAVRCNQLKEIYVPGQLERLEDNFVEDCPALRRVCLKWSQTVVNKKAFPENVRIWVL